MTSIHSACSVAAVFSQDFASDCFGKLLSNGSMQAGHIQQPSISLEYPSSFRIKPTMLIALPHNCVKIPQPSRSLIHRHQSVKVNSGVYVDTWWRHQMEIFLRNWPFVPGIHRSPVNSPHKGQWRGTLSFSFKCAWINGWVNNREAGGLRRYRADYDVK